MLILKLILKVILLVRLDNGILSVEINTLGAEMRSVKHYGKDRLWSGDKKFWSGTAPVLFPICGGLKNDKYTYHGREYSVEKHGFARNSEFKVVKQNALSAKFLLESTPETLKQFPWEFKLYITYTLHGSAIDVKYEVFNLSDDNMYMSIGSHEAYACSGGIENYDIIFERRETLFAHDVVGSLIADTVTPIIKDTDTLPLYYRYFEKDALVFKDVKSGYATLRNRITGESVSVDFPGCNYLLLWTKPSAGFICIEPWTGIPPMENAGDDITEKEGITELGPDSVYTISHRLKFE